MFHKLFLRVCDTIIKQSTVIYFLDFMKISQFSYLKIKKGMGISEGDGTRHYEEVQTFTEHFCHIFTSVLGIGVLNTAGNTSD